MNDLNQAVAKKTEKQPKTKTELETLYKKWPEIKCYMKSIGCNATEAEDLFQEALLIYVRKVSEPDFELTVDPFHYVKNTCKFLWYNLARKNRNYPSTELQENFADYQDDWFQKELKLKSIESALSKIGKQCQTLLQLFYGSGQSMVDIARKLGFRNDKVAKAQKYRCINKVKEQIRENESLTLNL